MRELSAAVAALETAIRTVEGLRVYTDNGSPIDPPAVLIAPTPDLRWEGRPGNPPTSATFIVAVLVAKDDRAFLRLWDLVPLVVEAIESVTDASVKHAEAVEVDGLPSYFVSVEVNL